VYNVHWINRFNHLYASFSSGEGRWPAALVIEIHYGQQQFQIVLLAPHQDGTKQGRRSSPSTCYLDGYTTIRCGRFGLALSVTGHFFRDISVHKELMKFDVNE